jgi:hypothetical protein
MDGPLVLARFEDLKPFVERIRGKSDWAQLNQYFSRPMVTDETMDVQYALKKVVLGCQLQFLISTFPESRSGSIRSMALRALSLLRQLRQLRSGSSEQEFAIATGRIGQEEFDEARNVTEPELSIVAALCLFKLSGIGYRNNVGPRSSITSRTDAYTLIYRATVILEIQKSRTPRHPGVLLLLAKLYVLLGCVSLATSCWRNLSIKRTLVDSVSPILYDRLSTVSLGFGAGSLANDVSPHYSSTCMNPRNPMQLVEAYAAQSHTAILQIPKFIDELRTSCTMVMAYVETTRSSRVAGTPVRTQLNDIIGKDRACRPI